jgi:hypothetical protein
MANGTRCPVCNMEFDEDYIDRVMNKKDSIGELWCGGYDMYLHWHGQPEELVGGVDEGD